MELVELGWDTGWAEAFETFAPDGLVPARVAIEFNHIYRVLAERGELHAQVAGRLRHRATGRHELAAVGDWVACRPSGGTSATIEGVLPRRSKFSRKVAGELTQEQVVAANIDTVFIVMGLDHDFNLRRLERYLLLAHESGAAPVVLLSKADLITNVEERIAEASSRSPGTPVHAISVKRRDHSAPFSTAAAIEIVLRYLGRGKTGALLGSSGVGKSTLINAIAGTELLKTAAVRSHDSRGRHTTRHRQLIVLPGQGLLIDTPGMRELQLWDVTGGAKETFEDIEALAVDCHFSDCRHRDEPRCAVKRAVEEERLSAARLESYHTLQDEMRTLEGRMDARAQIDEKRRAKTTHKALKRLYRSRRKQGR